VSDLDLATIQVFPKSKAATLEIITLLKNCFLTKNLSESEIEKIASAMKPQKFKKGELIIKYGDQGTLYYILSKGNVKVMVY